MIFLSAGHHKTAQGAHFNGVTEYDLTPIWTDKIAALLAERCMRVPNGTLKSKVNFINQHCTKNDHAIEIHFNSAKLWRDQNANGVVDDGEMVNVGRGSETLYYPSSKTGLRAANMVQNALEAVLPPNRGAKEGWYQMNPSKGIDFFLKRTACTSLIVEPEFIDNLELLAEKIDTACHVLANVFMEL